MTLSPPGTGAHRSSLHGDRQSQRVATGLLRQEGRSWSLGSSSQAPVRQEMPSFGAAVCEEDSCGRLQAKCDAETLLPPSVAAVCEEDSCGRLQAKCDAETLLLPSVAAVCEEDSCGRLQAKCDAETLLLPSVAAVCEEDSCGRLQAKCDAETLLLPSVAAVCEEDSCGDCRPSVTLSRRGGGQVQGACVL
ncbi:uncharacterized protein LOC114680375 isoform X1 [Macaca mulatta]